MTHSTIARDDLIVRGVYRLRARNLTTGVWTGHRWIGIREKFGDLSLDASEVPERTAFALELIEMLPDGIDAIEGESLCKYCRTPTSYDRSRGETWQERWFHVNGDTSHDAKSMHFQNRPLFDYLKEMT